jgi:hypothetical protein
MGLRIGWQPNPRVQLSLSGQDLLHDRRPEFGALTERSEIGRRAIGRVVWQF